MRHCVGTLLLLFETLREFSFPWRINPRHGIEGSYATLKLSG